MNYKAQMIRHLTHLFKGDLAKYDPLIADFLVINDTLFKDNMPNIPINYFDSKTKIVYFNSSSLLCTLRLLQNIKTYICNKSNLINTNFSFSSDCIIKICINLKGKKYYSDYNHVYEYEYYSKYSTKDFELLYLISVFDPSGINSYYDIKQNTIFVELNNESDIAIFNLNMMF